MAITAALIYCFGCPGCGETVVLPRTSALGTSDSLQYFFTNQWPVRYLCHRTEHIYEISKAAIRLGCEFQQAKTTASVSMWSIECECAVESCGKRHAIYTTEARDVQPAALAGQFFKMNPAVVCLGGHSAKFSRARMAAFRLD